MNILFLTSAMKDSDFASYQHEAKIKPNPSNQNFYSRLIKALALNNNIFVVSQRPFCKGMFRKSELPAHNTFDGNIHYYYTRAFSSKFKKALVESASIFATATNAIKDIVSNEFIVVVDTLKLNLVKAAKKIGKQYNVKVVGMLTDNPNNLSNSSPFINKALLKQGSSLDGYLSLSKGLVDVFNKFAPSYVFEGLVRDEEEIKKDPLSDYFYFSGSLYERYGVKELVDVFHESNIKHKLVIAGNGPLAKYIEEMEEKDYRILYLSQISADKNFSYMRNSIANINPRPLDPKLDEESIPSKLLEYLSVGVPTISTKFPKLYKVFKDDVTWVETSLIETLESFDLNNIKEYQKKAASARRKVFEFYGTNVQGESISHFLQEVNSLANF